jgi:hypothetical protein
LQVQRKHRETKLLSNRDALDALRLLGVERIECLQVYGKARGHSASAAAAAAVSSATRSRSRRTLALTRLLDCAGERVPLLPGQHGART